MSYLDHFSHERATSVYLEVLRLLEVEHWSRDAEMSAQRLAAHIGCDHRALSAALAISTGSNYHNLVASVRIKEAARCLKDPKYRDWNIEDIGLLCGFATRQSFYNAFRKFIGQPPKQYQKQHHVN